MPAMLMVPASAARAEQMFLHHAVPDVRAKAMSTSVLPELAC